MGATLYRYSTASIHTTWILVEQILLAQGRNRSACSLVQLRSFGATTFCRWDANNIHRTSFGFLDQFVLFSREWSDAPLSVAYAENFHEGFSFSGIWWSFVFGVRSLWRHNLTSYSCFQTNVLAKFVDIIGMFFYTHSLILCVIALNLNYQRSKLRYRRKMNSTLQHSSS